MEFPGFLGNAPVKEALSRAFSAGRFPHALLLQGEPGTGKGAFAQLVAQALVCRRKDHAPCGEDVYKRQLVPLGKAGDGVVDHRHAGVVAHRLQIRPGGAVGNALPEDVYKRQG